MLYSTLSGDAIAALRMRDPRRVDNTIAAAERILAHEFDLLGSGTFVPADPERPAHDGYVPIDWYLDPVRQQRFRRGVPHKQWNLYEMRPPNADIKYPWELGRCQHWATLGQAFAFTGDDRFAIEIGRELDDFVEANPVGIGVNWTCTMDVGIRAANWAIGLELAAASPALDEAFWLRATEALFDHGVFIRDNLENTYEVTSNHFLSNLLGLLFLGYVFDGLPHGAEWKAFSRAAIEHEMTVQVLADGADYESSVPYHRLVTELFVGALRLTDFRREPLSDAYRSRVRDMVAYLAAVNRPDGLMPQVGDADDGRLHIFEGYGTTTPQDARHLIGAAAAMFDEPSWRSLGGDAGEWEAAWWGCDTRSLTGGDRHATTAADHQRIVIAAHRQPTVAAGDQTVARLFPHAGIAVTRTAAGHYLLVTNGRVGTNGFGNHKHNDLLSFEYHVAGRALIVDAGSYVYTSDADARNRFRSTSYHNTIAIDDVEQNDMRADWLFRLFETSSAESIAFDDCEACTRYTGRHHGYERLADPVTHERTLTIDKASGDLTIVDRLTGRGRHQLRWHFHLAPGVDAEGDSSGVVRLACGEMVRTLIAPPQLAVTIAAAAYSPSYGVTVPCLALDLTADVAIEGERRWEFRVGA